TVLANGVSASTLTITVKDADGEPITGLIEGAFSFSGESDATIGSFTEVSGGAYTFEVTNTTAETVTLSVTVSGVPLGSFDAITFTAQTPDAGQSNLDVNPNSVLADGTASSALTITVKDAANQPITGLPEGAFTF